MCPEERKPTLAADFGPAHAIVELPIPGPAGPLYVEIEAAAPEELIELSGGLYALGGDASRDAATPEEQLAFLREHAEKARVLMERFVCSPAISFDGPREGAVEWRSLHLQNRKGLIKAIIGFSHTGSVVEAERLATFPPIERGRGPGGGGDGGPVAPGGAAGVAGAEPGAL